VKPLSTLLPTSTTTKLYESSSSQQHLTSLQDDDTRLAKGITTSTIVFDQVFFGGHVASTSECFGIVVFTTQR
jgi:hypothetical protein